MICEKLNEYKITVSSISGSKSYYPSDIVDKAIYELGELLRKSEQSKEVAKGIVRTFGKNVRTNNPKCGDILVLHDYSEESYDEWGNYTGTPTHEQYFVDFDTFDFDNLTVGCEAIGVVVENDNENVLVHYYKGFNDGDNNVVWASAWLYELTDIKLDGREYKIEFIDDTKNILEFFYIARSLEEFCRQLNTFLQEHQNSYSWHCRCMKNYKGEMSCIVIIDNIDSMYYDNIVQSGCIENKNMAFIIDEHSDNSLDNTDKLGKCLYQDINGNIRALFPLFYWTRYLSTKSKLNWFVPNKEQYKKIYDNIYQINKSLIAVKGDVIDCSNIRWTCLRYNYCFAKPILKYEYVYGQVTFRSEFKSSILSYIKLEK